MISFLFTICSHFPYLNDSLNGISFGQDVSGNWGYIKAGADTVIPFKHILSKTFIGSGTSNSENTFDVSNLDDYDKLSSDNFAIIPSSGIGTYGTYSSGYNAMKITYDSTAGKVTFSKSCGAGGSKVYAYEYKAYCFH